MRKKKRRGKRLIEIGNGREGARGKGGGKGYIDGSL